MLGRVVGLATFVVVAVATAEGRAAEAKTSSLSWLRMPGADKCVATQPLARAVEERLGRPVFVSASQADLSVEGRIERRAGGGWHAVLTVRDANGKTLGNRELDRPDASCDSMTEPLALVLAVMIDPDAAMHPKSPEPPPTSPTAPASAPPLPEPTATAPPKPETSPDADRPPPRKPTEPWRFEGGPQMTINYGTAPTVAPGVGVEAILYPPGVPVGFRGSTTLFLPTDAEKDGARASFDMLYATGSACPTLRGRANLLACIGGQLGLLRPRAETSGRGINEELLPILNVIAELRIHVPLVAPIAAAAGIGGGLPILRPEVDYRRSNGSGSDTLHKSAPYILQADVGVGLFFP